MPPKKDTGGIRPEDETSIHEVFSEEDDVKSDIFHFRGGCLPKFLIIIGLAGLLVLLGYEFIPEDYRLLQGMPRYIQTPIKSTEPQPQNPLIVLSPSPTPYSIKVIVVKDKKIPLEDVHVAKGPECDSQKDQYEHYHAKTSGVAVAIDGTKVIDPGGCGYGKVKDVPIEDVLLPL